ncbi:hypothetical protein E3P77_00578 [Wallemia ichthyophaga]|nr:hypothetical protein E3P77_00578 [Wallemia ichthyophaga]
MAPIHNILLCLGAGAVILIRIQSHYKPRVSYYYSKGIGDYHYGEKHPMKPHRLALTNSLVLGYGMHKYMEMYEPQRATRDEICEFHDQDYIDFLSRLSSPPTPTMVNLMKQFNMTDDCPAFPNLYDFCQQYAGASLLGARHITSQRSDIAVNWTGGLHHAHKAEASGFCYVNDIVLAILELLRFHPRVLYIDIDIHHGDGVQEAFYNSNRVMTVSFHKYTGDFFPGTGALDETGEGAGKHFSLNVPLQDGIDDYSYVALFKNIMSSCIESYRPSAILLQCGADSLGCDRLGAFNLSIRAHGECVQYIKSWGIPLMVVGGGGYTIRNVSRCWAYETSVLLDMGVNDTLPQTSYDEYFAPDYVLHPPIVTKVDNQNSKAGLERLVRGCREQLRYLNGAPSVQMQEIPPDIARFMDAAELGVDERDELQWGQTAASDTKHPDSHASNNEFFDDEVDQDALALEQVRGGERIKMQMQMQRQENEEMDEMMGGMVDGEEKEDEQIEKVRRDEEMVQADEDSGDKQVEQVDQTSESQQGQSEQPQQQQQQQQLDKLIDQADTTRMEHTEQPQQAAQPVVSLGEQPAVQTMSRPGSDWAAEPMSHTIPQTEPEPVAQMSSQPALQPAAQPISNSVAQPITQIGAQPDVHLIAKPPSQPVIDETMEGVTSGQNGSIAPLMDKESTTSSQVKLEDGGEGAATSNANSNATSNANMIKVKTEPA